jgi:putative membrane protein
MKKILKFILTALVVMGLAYILPGVEVSGFLGALGVALVLALLNMFVKPILVLFTLPATILTLGLFLMVINACIILLASWILGDSFRVENFVWALLFSILLSFIESIYNYEQKDR